MKKYLNFCLLLAFFCFIAHAQPRKAREKIIVTSAITKVNETKQNELPLLIPYRKGNKWGFCDKNKIIIIPCIYDYELRFTEGLAMVKLNNKWGLIDKTGKQVIPCVYDGTYDFREGLALVSFNGIFGYINNKGVQYWED